MIKKPPVFSSLVILVWYKLFLFSLVQTKEEYKVLLFNFASE